MPRGLLKIEAADGSRQDVPELLGDGSPNPLYDSRWTAIEAGAELGGATVGPDPARGIPQHYVVLDDAALAAEVQRGVVELARGNEVRSRTYQVFKRPVPSHAKTPAEEPELVEFGDVGDVFDQADVAKFAVDLGANRLVPLPPLTR